MIKIEYLTCNAFQENTYVLYDDSKECLIIDPGVSNTYEETMLKRIIDENGLKPVGLVNTHCHIDHVLGNRFVADQYDLTLGIHEKDQVMLAGVEDRAKAWGIPYTTSPFPGYFLKEGEVLKFGESELEIRFVPGHAPGHVVFVCHAQGFVIAGDTLFQGSIGRTDLPYGDFETLDKAIRKELYSLPDQFVVYPGHGPSTTIGIEKRTNPFVRIA